MNQLECFKNNIINDLKEFYWNTDIQNAKDDPCIVDAMIDLAIRTVNKNYERMKEEYETVD